MPTMTDALLNEECNGILTSSDTQQPEMSSPAGLCHIPHTQITSVSRLTDIGCALAEGLRARAVSSLLL